MIEDQANVLVTGGGGREHVFASLFERSANVANIYGAPGNEFALDRCSKMRAIFPDVKAGDCEGILRICLEQKIDLVVLGPEESVAADVRQAVLSHPDLQRRGVLVSGAGADDGILETSKVDSRWLQTQFGVYTPKYEIFSNPQDGISYVESQKGSTRFAIKADGLAAGKGVIMVSSQQQAKEAILEMAKFGKAGERFLIEEWVGGPNAQEFSGSFIVGESFDSKQVVYKTLRYAQDNKDLEDGDRGPKTGGMGATTKIAFAEDSRFNERVEHEIVRPVLEGMKRRGSPCHGILYLGGMYDPDSEEIFVIEFNRRMGDPEAEVVLPAVKNDLYRLLRAEATGNLDSVVLRQDSLDRVCVTAVARGYPDDYGRINGREIEGLREVLDSESVRRGEVQVYGAGIKIVDQKYFAAGGRVLHMVGRSRSITEARRLVYGEMSQVWIRGDKPGENLLFHRRDIGLKQLGQV